MASKAEIDVEVLIVREESIYVTDGDAEAWIPISLIDEDSDITGKSEVGTTGTLILPQWKAEDSGLV